MSEPWGTLKPSNSPRMTEQEIVLLSAGMVVSARERAAMVVGPGIVRHWTDGAWDRPTWLDIHDRVFLPRLPRLSFALTTDAVRERRKTITRRVSLPSWWKEGAWFLGVDRIRQASAQGLCVAQCGKPTQETLAFLDQSEVDKEGFPGTTPEGFRATFRAANPKWDGWLVWRLPFFYPEIPE